MSAALELPEDADQPKMLERIVTLNPVTVFAGGMDNLLEALERSVMSEPADISSEKGRKHMRSVAYKVARSKTWIDGSGKTLKDEYRKKGDAIDADRRKAREFCDALAERYLTQLTAWETKEADRIKGHEDALAAMSSLLTDFPDEASSQQIKESLDKLDTHEDGRDWGEFAQRANDLHAEIGFALTRAMSKTLAREQAAAEAERNRLAAEEAARVEAARIQAEREARIAEEAAEAARIAAEAREAERAAMERQRVERERLAAEAAAKAEMDRIEEERLQEQIAAQAEIEAIEEAHQAQLAAEQEKADRLDYQRRLIEHINQCGFGFIGGQPQAPVILIHELEKKIAFSAETFGDLLAEAIAAKETALTRIQAAIAAGEERRRSEEEKTAAIERTRRAEAAAEQARRDAHAARAHAEADRIAAAARAAVKEKADVAARIAAQGKADADAVEAARQERQKIAEEQAREKRAADARAADRENRASIHREIVADLIESAGLNADQAKRVVESMVRAHIRHVEVKY